MDCLERASLLNLRLAANANLHPNSSHNRSQVTSGLVLPCGKMHLAPYMKIEKALSLKAEDDFGRQQLLGSSSLSGTCR
jgi:hypothetical protein